MPQGLFEPRVMFFGMTNAPACFQQTMDQMFQELKNKYPTKLFEYIDDILIATTNNLPQYKEITHQVLNLLEQESFFLKPYKCLFEQKWLKYLGVVVDGNNLQIEPSKIKGITYWPTELKMVKQVRSTLGILGYQ